MQKTTENKVNFKNAYSIKLIRIKKMLIYTSDFDIRKVLVKKVNIEWRIQREKGHDSHFFCCKKCAEEKSNLYYEYCRYTGNESTFKGSVLWCFQNQCDEVHGATN